MTNYILYMIDMQDDIIHAVLFLSIVQLVCYVCMYYTGLNPGGGGAPGLCIRVYFGFGHTLDNSVHTNCDHACVTSKMSLGDCVMCIMTDHMAHKVCKQKNLDHLDSI